ncbi:cytochrome ubiquinol oxidase subunit I, partial [Francisella tularensis]
MRSIMYFVEILSRIQFAFTVIYHILFTAFSIGLSTILMIFEALWMII